MREENKLFTLISIVTMLFLSSLVTTQAQAQTCFITVTRMEGDLFPGGLAFITTEAGSNSVAVDSVNYTNAGVGLVSITIVGVPSNAIINIPAFTPGTFDPVLVTFTQVNPALSTDFTLRAVNGRTGMGAGHGPNSIFIRVRCDTGPTTAALLTINGRVLSSNGRGVSKAIVTLTDTSGEIRSTKTNSFGYFSFDEIPGGDTYIVGVRSKRYTFTPQVVSGNDELTDLSFVAEP